MVKGRRFLRVRVCAFACLSDKGCRWSHLRGHHDLVFQSMFLPRLHRYTTESTYHSSLSLGYRFHPWLPLCAAKASWKSRPTSTLRAWSNGQGPRAREVEPPADGMIWMGFVSPSLGNCLKLLRGQKGPKEKEEERFMERRMEMQSSPPPVLQSILLLPSGEEFW